MADQKGPGVDVNLNLYWATSASLSRSRLVELDPIMLLIAERDNRVHSSSTPRGQVTGSSAHGEGKRDNEADGRRIVGRDRAVDQGYRQPGSGVCEQGPH